MQIAEERERFERLAYLAREGVGVAHQLGHHLDAQVGEFLHYTKKGALRDNPKLAVINRRNGGCGWAVEQQAHLSEVRVGGQNVVRFGVLE